jgi:transposase
MNDLVANYPGRELHVVLDNLNTHKPKEDRWLKAHHNLHLHFIPTHSSLLNQVECWFSILSRSTLQGVNFTTVRMLIEATKLLSLVGIRTRHPSNGPRRKYTSSK